MYIQYRFYRMMGLTAIYSSSCIGNESDVRVIEFDANLDLDKYFNLLLLIVCYITISITSCVLLGPQVFNVFIYI